MIDDGLFAPLAAAICDGAEVDWEAARATARSDADRRLLGHLETIAAASPRRPKPPLARRPLWPSVARAACVVTLTLASAKTLLTLAGCVTAFVPPGEGAAPPWPYVASLSELSPSMVWLLQTVDRHTPGYGYYWLCVLLVSLAPVAAHSVFAHRVRNVGLVLKQAMQYRVARRFVWAITVAPAAALAAYVYARHRLAIAEIIDSRDSLALLAVVAAGVLVLAARRRLLIALDRIFLREPLDHAEAMAELERRLREASGAREIAAIVALEIDRAVHPQSIAVFLNDRDGRQLLSAEGTARSLDLNTPLGALLVGARQEIQVGRTARPIWNLLPEADREWLESGGYQLLIPLAGRAGRLVGAVALGEKRGELPYTREERLLLRVMAAQAAITLENCRLRRLPGLEASATADSIDSREEPAAQCPSCRLVWPSSTRDCRCGVRTQPAALPAFPLAKFRLERLLGAGGMGLVYLAEDLSLDRKVAIKTLRRLTAERARQLEHEARAMARVQHPNLAVVFGVEEWDGYPLLIVEYLEGGTLADRLRQSRMTLLEALSLGVVLGDALDRVHASGMLHRDIKPGNIGYSAEGVPKLLDFGLACLVGDAADVPTADAAPRVSEGTFVARTTATPTHHLAGTVQYLSPEAVGGAVPDYSFDLWSLSLVLFEAVAGVNPLAPSVPPDAIESILTAKIPDIREFCPDCPPAVARFFRGALAASRDARPPTAAAMRSQCQRLLAEMSMRSCRASSPSAAWASRRDATRSTKKGSVAFSAVSGN